MSVKKRGSWIGLALYVGAIAVPATALADNPLPVLQKIRLKGLKGNAKAAARNAAVQKLVVDYSEHTLGDGRKVLVRTYNGQLVGPTLRAKPGETIIVDLVNDLPPDPGDQGGGHNHHAMGAANPNEPGGFNVTNLHFHGMHVRPDFPSRCDGLGVPTNATEAEEKRKKCGAVADNVLIEVNPGETQRYEIEIPKNHPPGTHWYHAHKHGATAMHLASGMAGALIIEGGLDEVKGIKGIKDQEMVFQQLSFSTCGRNKSESGPKDCNGHESCATYFKRVGLQHSGGDAIQCVENFNESFGANKWPTVLQSKFGNVTTINGAAVPTITMKQGEIQRWRLLQAGIHETIKLGLSPKDKEETQKGDSALTQGAADRIQFQAIAYDGLATGTMKAFDSVELQPGYRVDALVRVDKPGTYQLTDLATTAQDSLQGTSEKFKVIAEVVVEPSAQKAMPWPTPEELKKVAYNPEPVADAEVTGCQYTTFSIDGTAFMVNEKSFGAEASTRKMVVGRSEEWVVNSLLVNSRVVNHPFHIHVNPFQLVEEYDGLPAGTWKDTLLVQATKPVRIRTRYEDFTGGFVLHCHILDHEDQGMMQLVEILPKEREKEATVCPVPEVSDPADPNKKLKMCAVPPPPDGTCPGGQPSQPLTSPSTP
jgi:FtsP/CotA-like multicopper oxidase with cupredoxin domain